MSKKQDVEKDARAALFKELGEVHVGMLGLENAHDHMQPMSHFADNETGTLWFISATDTDLVQKLGAGSKAHYCLVGKSHDFYACISGKLEQVHDEKKLDELWSAPAAAWFDKGREDPRVALLKFTLGEAKVHGTTGSAVHFGVEVARANMKEEKKPDVGEVAVVEFDHAA